MTHPGPTSGKDRSFFGVELKLARARMHAQTLGASVAEWQSHPLSAHGEISEDRRKYKLVLDDFPVVPPVELWGMLIGDCVHNLRSALDNLCFSAARLKRDPPADPRGIQFPIFDTREPYEGNAARTLKQLPDAAVRLLEHFQPFQKGAADEIRKHSLMMLQHLSNQDKHRIPQVALLRVHQSDHRQELTFESNIDAEEWIAAAPHFVIEGGPVWAGSTLISVTCSRPAGRIQGTVTVEAFPVIDTPLGLQGACPAIDALALQVVTIFEAFRLTFPNARD
jgi:hypothetical protein